MKKYRLLSFLIPITFLAACGDGIPDEELSEDYFRKHPKEAEDIREKCRVLQARSASDPDAAKRYAKVWGTCLNASISITERNLNKIKGW
ncbi:hypothetical protein A4G18_02000 [Pasteurellaceae bacterium Pebbles2]|nr:hypothetical protein [Pasteurellaceae bacterium Pebbles2]